MKRTRTLFGFALAVTMLMMAQPPGQTPANTPQQPQAETPKAPAVTPEQEAVRTFLAIGAPPDAEAAKRGQALFVANCGFCHGSNAGGGATGPNLVRSVLVLHDAGTAKEIGPVVHNGRTGKGMPAFPNLTEAQLHDLAAFLLGRTQAVANRMEYKIENIVTGDAKAGAVYFQQHCAECHSATGDLAHIATKLQPVDLQSRFLYPAPANDFGMGPPPDPKTQPTVKVTLPSGQTYSGMLDGRDDFSIGLKDDAGIYHSWLLDDTPGIRVDVHDPLAEHARLLKQYTDADMHNILAYLETLK